MLSDRFTVRSNRASGFLSMSYSAPKYDQPTTDFLVLVGRIVIGWSRIERAIDIAVLTARHLIPEHFKKGPPFALKLKVKAFRTICERVAKLADNLPWIESRIGELLVLAEQRHTIVHGYFHGISGEAEPQIYFRRAPPLSGEAGDRLLATRQELGALLTKVARADHDFSMIMLVVMQEVRKARKTNSYQPFD